MLHWNLFLANCKNYIWMYNWSPIQRFSRYEKSKVIMIMLSYKFNLLFILWYDLHTASIKSTVCLQIYINMYKFLLLKKFHKTPHLFFPVYSSYISRPQTNRKDLTFLASPKYTNTIEVKYNCFLWGPNTFSTALSMHCTS